MSTTMITRRHGIVLAIILISTVCIYRSWSLIPENITTTTEQLIPSFSRPKSDALSPEVLTYFDQAFSVNEPTSYDFPALRQQCKQTKWPEDDVYLKCGGMAAGLTSIMSQVKVCMKMALDAGVNIVLPAMPLRSSTDLTEFNFLNPDAYLTYDKWFDQEHFIKQIERACPKMKVIHPDDITSKKVEVKNEWMIDIAKAPGFVPFQSYFWAGRPFKTFFEAQYKVQEQTAMAAPGRDENKMGLTVITISSQFLLYRVMDDPTGHDMRLWSDLSHLIRFGEGPRKIVNSLLARMDRPYYGVHFRAESDTIWSSADHQMQVDLDALDTAWVKYGKPGGQKPMVYLACGDEDQVNKFKEAGKARGWDVTHKWLLADGDEATLKLIKDLAFDFQGAVDMGMMVRSHFFLGIIGSAFSSTVGNARDVTGRYRGSSFNVWDDGNARSHLFNDGDAGLYACCL